MSAAASVPSSRRGPSSQITRNARGAMVSVVHERLVKALGATRAGEVLDDALARFGDRQVETAQDLFDLAALLIGSGGLVQAVGRSLKVMALLRGAAER